MGLIEFILIAVVIGLIVWVVTTYLPLPAPFPTIILVVAVVVLLLVLVRAMGFDMPIPRIR